MSMTLLFELTMPNRGSWDGRWSGENRRHLLIRAMGNTKVAIAKASELNNRSWRYSWPDGWGANVSCRIIESRQVNSFKKLSDGFCGYDWMVDSILQYDKILANHEKPEPTWIQGVSDTLAPHERGLGGEPERR